MIGFDKACHTNDRVIGRQTGDVIAPVIPVDLRAFADERLRVLDGEVIDAADFSEFHIGDDGYKHIVAGDGRQPLACAWDDELTLDGGAWRVVSAAERLRKHLTAYAADRRWRKENGGIVVGGVPIATDDRSKQMIIGARLAADADPDWTTQWVGADGSVHPVNAAAMIAISDAVQAHVNACFVTYAAVKTDIDAGTITTTEEIDAAFAA